MIKEGADIIDIGGCSTRPGYSLPLEEDEWERVDLGCSILREVCPDIPLSIDTFRVSVAEKAINKWRADIINDISGGKDPEIWNVVATYKKGYILTHNPDPIPSYEDVTAEVITWLSKKVNDLHRLGVCDVILDPGFGFAKTTDENFHLVKELDEIKKMGLPLLAGVSRKSMIYKTLECTPEESLIGTVALNTVCLLKGADILRIHDVKAAKDIVKLIEKIA